MKLMTDKIRFGAMSWIAFAACSGAGSSGLPNPVLETQTSGTVALLQAVSVVDDTVAWVSGHQATFARTVDGGQNWISAVVPGPDTLQFRDVHAVDAVTAYLLSAGPGDMSRIYKTTDAGLTWTLQFTNQHPDAFFDCMDFWDAESGLAFGDAVDGKVVLIRTTDGGANWNYIPGDNIPDAAGNEGGFAASGTCLVTQGSSNAWIGTGAGDTARVYRTSDRGDTWSVVETPIMSGTSSSGIASVVVRSGMEAVVLGGDIGDADSYTDNVATTSDGGATWKLTGRPTFSGAVYGAAGLTGRWAGTLVAVGPQGASLTVDNGATWTGLDTLGYWAVGLASADAGWMVGPQGRITKISVR